MNCFNRLGNILDTFQGNIQSKIKCTPVSFKMWHTSSWSKNLGIFGTKYLVFSSTPPPAHPQVGRGHYEKGRRCDDQIQCHDLHNQMCVGNVSQAPILFPAMTSYHPQSCPHLWIVCHNSPFLTPCTFRIWTLEMFLSFSAQRTTPSRIFLKTTIDLLCSVSINSQYSRAIHAPS